MLKYQRILLLLKANILLFSCTGGYAQQDIMKYYQYERQARKFALQHQKDSSLTYYLLCFKERSDIPPKVLKSALKVSRKVGDREATDYILTLLMGHRNEVNKDYEKQIANLMRKDQKVRSRRNMNIQARYRECIRNGGCSNDKMTSYRKVLQHWNDVDSSNISELLMLMGKYGFPAERVAGTRGYWDAIIIMIHFDRDSNNVTLGPLISEALKRGEIKPKDYAWIIDRRLTMWGKEAYYYHIPMGYDQLSPEEKEEIDRRRRSIGLGTIAESQVVIPMRNGVKVRYID